jgi:hypothetical protein
MSYFTNEPPTDPYQLALRAESTVAGIDADEEHMRADIGKGKTA